MHNLKIEFYSGIGLAVTATLLLVVLLSGGCFRKHIPSTPPAHKRADRTEPAPTPAPAPEKKAEPGIIEETYVVDAPAAQDTPDDMVAEGDLAEEPLREEAAQEPDETISAEDHEAIKEDVQAEMEEAVDEAESGPSAEPMPAVEDLYYVQVGAFSDLDNANNVLADLLSRGYDGSRLVEVDGGLYRVQAGGFTDEAAAREGLLDLQRDYPRGFILPNAK